MCIGCTVPFTKLEVIPEMILLDKIILCLAINTCTHRYKIVYICINCIYTYSLPVHHNPADVVYLFYYTYAYARLSACLSEFSHSSTYDIRDLGEFQLNQLMFRITRLEPQSLLDFLLYAYARAIRRCVLCS